jgi:hypothetical protein
MGDRPTVASTGLTDVAAADSSAFGRVAPSTAVAQSAANAVASTTKSKQAVASLEAKAKAAMAEAENAIGRLGLPTAVARSLKDVAKQAVARNLAEQKAQIAEADMNAKIERDVELAEKSDRRTALAAAYSNSALSGPAAFRGTKTTAPRSSPPTFSDGPYTGWGTNDMVSKTPMSDTFASSGYAARPTKTATDTSVPSFEQGKTSLPGTLSGLPDTAEIAPSEESSIVDLGKIQDTIKEAAKQIAEAPAKGAKIAKEAVEKEVAKVKSKLEQSGVPQAIVGQAVAQARAQIAAQLSRGIDDEIIRQRLAEAKKAQEEAAKAAADKKKKKKQKPSNELEKLLAELSRAAA